MPKLYSGKEVAKSLERAGFVHVSTKGSHMKFRGVRNSKMLTVIVPYHKELAMGTFSSVLSQAEMTRDEFQFWYR